ncbi:MAG: hypothetical protein KDI66_14430 [Xanthomonadales bacterium]|nr:hypothetical protein [Xanthomonadales bacterium]
MLARLIATVAALLLACASPQADAYVRTERVSMSLADLADLAVAQRSELAIENAHQAKSASNPKTAPPARARPAEPTSSKNAALTHCRIWKNWSPLQKCASVPAVYQWDGTKLAGNTNALGNPIADYQHAYSWPLSSRENGERSYLHPDTHGTPQLITTATGAIAGWTRTDIWGVPQADSGQQSAIGYTGYLKDPLLDELYAQARQYRPGAGRFTSVDPWEGDPNNPLSLNKYLYANGNPGVFLDPTGRYGEEGHYYTTYYVALRVGFSAEDAKKLALYSQVPDELSSLDAVALEKSARFSRAFGRRDESIARRDAVHPAVHALAGTNAQRETEITVDAIRRAGQAEDLRSAGILIHRLGDTFAHRMLASGEPVNNSSESVLYSTGNGHGSDGHTPDIIQ